MKRADPEFTPQTTPGLRGKLNEVIFGCETRAGRVFDLLLILCILLSVLVVILASVPSVRAQFGRELDLLEWAFTLLFTLEYGLRLYCAFSPSRYAFSFFGLVDLLTILPTWLSLFFPQASYLLVFRILRVLRIFRILKLFTYIGEASLLMRALMQSRRKIMIFFFCVIVLNVFFGSLMFLVEGPENGFNSIPESIYWSILTLTTVGNSDISPQSVIGRGIAALAMIVGYSIIAVPTGIFSSELISQAQSRHQNAIDELKALCHHCGCRGHASQSNYCRDCGAELGT
jgi:voltage-gated potassium channel